MIAELVDALIQQENSAEEVPVLHLFGGPFVTSGDRRLDVPEGGQRLLVFAALHGRRVERRRVAGTLWPVGDDARSAGNLRSALWRLKRAGLPLITADKQCLTIRSDVIIDVQLVSRWTTRLIHGHPSAQDLATVPGGVDELDLLPGWYDDWVLYERERQRQRLLHALESLTDLLVVEGQHAEAVDAAMVAIGAEPLRETAHLALMRAHRAEGNWVEVRRSYQVYRDLLWRELGVEPGRAVTELARRPSPQPYPVGSVRSAPA